MSIIRKGGNKNGRFVEAAVYGVGGRRGFLLIPEDRGGWGWLKSVGELRKAKDFVVTTVGCGFRSSSLAEKVSGKKVGPGMGRVVNCIRPLFVEVVWVESCLVATTMFTLSRQGNPLGTELADSARPLGFLSIDPQGKEDGLCFVPGDVRVLLFL